MTVATCRYKQSCACSASNTIVISLHFNRHFYRRTWISQYQNVSILDFIEAKDDGGGGGDNWSYKGKGMYT